MLQNDPKKTFLREASCRTHAWLGFTSKARVIFWTRESEPQTKDSQVSWWTRPGGVHSAQLEHLRSPGEAGVRVDLQKQLDWCYLTYSRILLIIDFLRCNCRCTTFFFEPRCSGHQRSSAAAKPAHHMLHQAQSILGRPAGERRRMAPRGTVGKAVGMDEGRAVYSISPPHTSRLQHASTRACVPQEMCATMCHNVCHKKSHTTPCHIMPPSHTHPDTPRRDCHEHTHHNYISHNYIGHNYIGHHYISHNYVSYNYISHNYIGHNYIGHEHTHIHASIHT